ncbi:hypothetical protein BKA00_006810 [Actinomadura coerulea]|uniref:Uncharacterized protein n=1 Tax=Actinomadura coerulea TaxID=46159 RepID=A0A7X0G7U5_9ACTN|nr:hypothetical protein [Actinomadura coerulea]MBB6399896.1 hypothetical protein [Actinomadura coerulea]
MSQPSLTGILRSTVATVLTLLAAVAFVAFAVALAVTNVPDGTRDLDAYRAAPRCPAAPPGPAECRWTREFTVSGVRLTSKRGELDTVTLTDADGGRQRTAYTDRGPVIGDLAKGDRVTGTVWRGRLTEVAARGESQDTDAAPDDLRARYLIAGLIMIPPGVLVAAACVWRLGRRTVPNPSRGMVATLGLAVGVFFAGLFSPVVASGAGEDLRVTAAVWLPIAALMAVGARVYTIRGRNLAG